MIDLAAKQKINRIQLSHNIVMYAEELFWHPEQARNIEDICKYARAKGLKTDLWTHEIEGFTDDRLKDGKADLDDPATWEWLQQKYRKLFDLVPSCDGLVLTMHETQIYVWDDRRVKSSLSPEKRIGKLLNTLDEVCKERGKKLIVRTFAYEPKQLDFILNGLKEAPDDVIAMSKCVPHDWQPYYPNGPDIGKVGKKQQIVEFDLGNEFTGLSTIPYIDLPLIQSRLNYGIKNGIDGAVLRVERLKWRAVDSPNQMNINVFSQILSDPGKDWKPLLKKQLVARYGAKSAPTLFTAFSRTMDIVNEGYFVLGYWVTNHSLLPDYGYAKKSLTGRTTAKWDPSTKPTQDKLFNPTPAIIAEMNRQKDHARNLARLSLADIEKAKTNLKPADYAQLRTYFGRLVAMVDVWKPAMEVIFGLDVYKRTKSDADRQFLLGAADRLENQANKNKQALIQMAASYAKPKDEVNYNAALGLVKLARDTAGAK